MHVYKTNEVAKIIGIHANTVRLYEACGLISKPERQSNGYRVFTSRHMEQFKMARAVLKVEVLQNGLRKQVIAILKLSAQGDLAGAKKMAKAYLQQVELEMNHAEEATEIARSILNCYDVPPAENITLTRKEAAKALKITTDTLRNWELNGLISIKRKQNQYRVYSHQDIQRLKIIRTLRCANYSLTSILRMLQALSQNPATNIREAINTPREHEDIVTACDKLLTSLLDAKRNMQYALSQMKKLQKMNE